MTDNKINKCKSAKELEVILHRVGVINRYLDLFKSCSSKLSRDIVLRNAKELLSRSDYIILLESCCDYLRELYDELVASNRKIDEPFIY